MPTGRTAKASRSRKQAKPARSRILPPTHERTLAGLRNLGPRSAAWLVDVGILSRDDLARVGSIEACRRMRAAGHPASLLAACAIEAALMDVHWQTLPPGFKRDLTAQYRQMERDGKSPDDERSKRVSR